MRSLPAPALTSAVVLMLPHAPRTSKHVVPKPRVWGSVKVSSSVPFTPSTPLANEQAILSALAAAASALSILACDVAVGSTLSKAGQQSGPVVQLDPLTVTGPD